MNAIVHRLVEIASLFLLVALCLWLTLIAISGNYISLLFILLLAVVFAAAKEPYRKSFIINTLIVAVFLIYPVEIRVRRGNNLQVNVQKIVYGLLPLGKADELEREGIVSGGCIVYPWSAQLRIQVTVP